jgi:hypothetical protein
MKATFGSIAVQPQNKEQIEKISQIAYKTKEVANRRYGEETPVLKANIDKDTVTFSCPGNQAKQDMVEGILMHFLRQVNIPFKET